MSPQVPRETDQMDMQLAGKKVLITGGSKGIGLAAAKGAGGGRGVADQRLSDGGRP